MNKFFKFLLPFLLILFIIPILSQIFLNNKKEKNIENEIAIIHEKIMETDVKIEKYNTLLKNLDDEFGKEKIARNELKMVKNKEKNL